MFTLSTTCCPVCGGPTLRAPQPSGPAGSAAGERGPRIAYPCNCWIPVETARAAIGGVSHA
jgi:hypothetical protein